MLCLDTLETTTTDEDMAPMDMPMKVKDKVSSYLCLHNDKTKNLLLPNIGIPNVFRNNGDDDREWICHEQDRSQSANPSKLHIRFTGSTTLLHWEGHNSFIRSEFEVHEHLIKWIWFDLNITSAWPPNHHNKLPMFLPKAVSSSWA